MDTLELESTLTDRYQTTVPDAVRRALGLGKRDRIRYIVQSNGSVILQRATQSDDPVLGSSKTEKTLAAFQEGKVRAQERLAAIREQLGEQARLNKALRLARVPRVVGRIVRGLDEQGLLGTFTVLGTQAMYAYEAAGGVQFLTRSACFRRCRPAVRCAQKAYAHIRSP